MLAAAADVTAALSGVLRPLPPAPISATNCFTPGVSITMPLCVTVKVRPLLALLLLGAASTLH
jgi:hypothetical protein